MTARGLGLDGDLGSLEKGKLADLIILDRNPLGNIRNSESLAMVMPSGRLYETATLNEIGNQPRKPRPFWCEGEPNRATSRRFSNAPPASPLAFWMTAVRELLEENGVLARV